MTVRGELTATGPGCVVRFSGDAVRPRVCVEGRLPRADGPAGELLTRLAGSGVVIDVTDPSGRLLATVGGGRPSRAGRLLAGSPAVRLTARGIAIGILGRLARTK